MKTTFWLLAVLALTASGTKGTEASASPPEATPKGRVVTTTLHSVVLGRDVALHVWLPPGYEQPADSEKKYPVIYLFDGTNLFDAAGDAKEKMHLDASLDRLVSEGSLRPIIVVGIEQPNDSAARAEEYKVMRDPYVAPDGPEPHGARLPDFLRAEVMPKIAGMFRVSSEASQTGIGGLSYGGAAALYVLMHCPTTFGLAVIESPSLQLGNGQLLRDSVYLLGCGERVAIGIGTAEITASDKVPRTPEVNRGWVRACETLATNLRAAYVPPQVRLEIDPDASHEFAAWARRFPRDLVFLFGAKS